MSDIFDPYHRWLGISPKDQPPNHYRLLGIDLFEDDQEVIRDAAERQTGHVRRYQLGRHMALSQKILNEIAAASAVLGTLSRRTSTTKASGSLCNSSKRLRRPPPLAPIPSPVSAVVPPPSPAAGRQPPVQVAPPAPLPIVPVGPAAVARPSRAPAAQPVATETQRPQGREMLLITAAAAAAVLLLGWACLGLLVQRKPASDGTTSATAPETPAAALDNNQRLEAEQPTVTRPTPLALKETTVDLGDGVTLELVLIPAGDFLMGSPDSDDKASSDEKPQHRVRLTKPFYLGKYLVTQEQWEAVMGDNPSQFKGPKNPVEEVSWEDCQQFVGKLNTKIGGGESSAAHRGAVGICLPGREYDEVLLWG